ncbi:hypothetical protein AMS68_008068 [Peltaster fructicola]|uniref:FAD-binding domain-containing protein n=1 Tax=Peltaster fructicola TaxID=286661 RepID=A0A6H0Y6T3_9PEZI|nr:hypothetical protein AMS68_008068 [Peltaster fructicola]
MPLKVLIVGASIAGPAAAYWFARAGASVTVIERFPSFRKGGQNVDIRSVGVTVMRKLPGLEDAIRSKLYHIDGFQFVDTHGAPIATMLATGNPEQQSVVSEYEIFRGDLSGIFYDLTKDKVKYIFDEQVKTLQQSEDSITVEFQSGSTDIYDLVVACDGATSRTRALGFECGVRDHIRPLNAWASYFTIPNNITNTNMGQSYSAVPGLFLGVGPDPVTHGNKVALISIHQGKDATLPFREAQKDDLKSFVCDRLRGQGWKCDEIIKGLQDCEDLYASELVQVKVPQLSKGRFVLVGDAGYSAGSAGMGTSMAMAGAYILAGEIMKHNSVKAGLQGYEDRMRPIIKDLGSIPPGVPGILAPQTAWGLYFRNMLFKVVAFGTSLGPYFSWINGIFGTAFAKDKFGIPDYDWST